MYLIPEFIRSYPMGPALRQWIGLSDAEYLGTDAQTPTSAEEDAFSTWVLDLASDQPIVLIEQFTNVIEELVGMHLAATALKLVGYFPDLVDDNDFRTQFQIGNASMIAGDLELAEISFRRAQEIIPEDTAPYVNLTQIYYHQNRDEEARAWCMSGLDADLNHARLWEQLAVLEIADHGAEAGASRILELSKARGSWAGLSLACDMAAPENPEMKLAHLEPLYYQGLRDKTFLIELTAVMGAAGKYEQIAPVVWQAEKLGTSPLPWQLWMHAAQAQLGLGKGDLCREYLTKVQNIPDLPESVPPVIAQLMQESTEA